ncbi:four helix bundle protein [Catalinimonas alkaloidigena]|uniref:four helix bundle protein n=1 Tax=Catalinimonas alkaloidigena TaxID=1075417 RepID=UPI002406AF40|nr:four helix bundle protein [Catalinimonas alkaloidigena]
MAYKEARKAKYWLKVLKATDYIDEKAYESLMKDCEELLKLLFVIIKNSKE